ncbi:putative gustatory receptor 28b [Monomorium pharaonis]|uniref:putative gustatory receptor 28b n=1 Tax=Monomorium pharaonis TaxID=307658 RepID=UPI00102E191F|nr:putative gustatory receptor 28b [Monomorium pharaonis]
MFNPLSKFQGQVKSKRERKRWWLFHATDFPSLMYPCFIFGRILGTFPYTINGLSFVISKPFYILSNIVMCVFCFGLLILIVIMNFYKKYDNGNNEEDIIANNFYNITRNFIIITTIISNKQRMRVLQTIIKISSNLSSGLYQMSSVLIHAKDIFGFSYLIMHTLYGLYIMQIPFLHSVMLLYINLLVFQMDMLYINCVYVLKVCFKKINDDLANLLVNNDESHLVKWINHEQRNHLLLELKTIKKQHLMISNTVQKLNITFSPQLLATLGLCFISITFELYYNIQWKNGLYINWTKEFDHTWIMIDVVHYCIKLAMIAWACETGKTQAIKINTTVHDMLNSIDDNKISRELQLFSLQIMHCDNTFSAKGLTLDATLITKVNNNLSTIVYIPLN